MYDCLTAYGICGICGAMTRPPSSIVIFVPQINGNSNISITTLACRNPSW